MAVLIRSGTMRILLIDPFNGAAGDMMIGSLLQLGADREQVVRAMRSVVGEPVISSVIRCGISAMRVETCATEAHRTLEEVLERLAVCDAPEKAKEMAKRVFHRIHRAETAVHGTVAHFHEVGADDAVADVVGACTALHSLAVDGVAVFPVHLGTGSLRTSHGIYPLPAPATLEILKEAGLDVQMSGESSELCTPTGAALLAEFSSYGPGSLGGARILAVGYGAGRRDPPHTPNVLRSVLMDSRDENLQADCIDLLETSVDDITGEVLASALTRLMEEGARDVCAIPQLMKKGRSGYLVRVIANPSESKRLAETMAEELGSLGIRCIPSVHRFIAPRFVEQVEIEVTGRRYLIDIKVGKLRGHPYSVKAEYDQAQAAARETGMTVREIKRLAEDAWQRRQGSG
jgi:uncharacterized protein (TIGR00299 family) protein